MLRRDAVAGLAGTHVGSGSGSVVEYLLAKEGVEGSNPFFRSKNQIQISPREKSQGLIFTPMWQLSEHTGLIVDRHPQACLYSHRPIGLGRD